MSRVVGPSLFEVRAHVLLETVRASSLAHVPRGYFSALRQAGFDVLYLLGVWTTGEAALRHSEGLLLGLGLGHDEQGHHAASSPFAVAAYHTAPSLGGDAALRQFRAMANAAGLAVWVDFVPNHVAVDHVWTRDMPWLFVQGSDEEAARHPDRYFRPTTTPSPASGARAGTQHGANAAAAVTDCPSGVPPPQPPAAGEIATPAPPPPPADVWLAHGRDPHSGGWRDTAQLNYRHPHTRSLMKAVLVW